MINNDPFFKLLHDEGVKFYDENIKADYTSYDYIETLPFDFYPKHIKDEADAIESDILKTVKKTFKEITIITNILQIIKVSSPSQLT